MTVEEFFQEWWTPNELPKYGFNKTAMLDFAEAYASQQRAEIDELIKYYEDKVEIMIRASAENMAHARTEGIREGFEAAREWNFVDGDIYQTVEDYLSTKS